MSDANLESLDPEAAAKAVARAGQGRPKKAEEESSVEPATHEP